MAESRFAARARLTERLLTETGRRRALTEQESLLLEGAIAAQSDPRIDRRGRRLVRRYSGDFLDLVQGEHADG